jgi:predicted Zn finger-like uncharacterized protein
MQFSCESCQATLHIGDDKVKGKRLVVRCKRCGARIQIADPALGPASAASIPPAAVPKSAPRPAPVPAPAPEPEPSGETAPVGGGERDTDTESTRAMDTALLEKALQASKRDDASISSMAPVAAEAAPPAAAPRDPPVWFAMISGKQTGPVSRAELGLKVAQGTVTGRTYMWREGMGGWVRAAEVAELSVLFSPPPAKPAPAPAQRPVPVASRTAPPPAARPSSRPQLARAEAPRAAAEFATADFAAVSAGGNDDAGISLQLDGPVHRPGVSAEPMDPEVPPPHAGRVTAPGRPSSKPQAAAVQAVQPAAEPEAELPELSADGLERVDGGEPLQEDRTNVEALPLGERVHQEEVAKALFASGEHAHTGVSAVDLAKWASSELSKRPNSGKVAPQAAAASEPPQQRYRDPFASVPDAPGLKIPSSVDTTGRVLARSGVKKSRVPQLLAIGALVIGAFLALFWALTREEKPSGPAPAPAVRSSVGGSGDTSVGQLAKGDAKGKKVAAAPSDKGDKPGDKPGDKQPDRPPEPITAEQEAALKNLDNERGIGSHGPKSAEAAPAEKPAAGDTGLSPADIRKKLVENKGALQSCIDEALKKDPSLHVGKIHIATTIAPSGTVTATKIDKREVDDSALGECLKRATRRILFPAFTGDPFDVDIPIQVTAGD